MPNHGLAKFRIYKVTDLGTGGIGILSLLSEERRTPHQTHTQTKKRKTQTKTKKTPPPPQTPPHKWSCK